jgi:hypothetical protein
MAAQLAKAYEILPGGGSPCEEGSEHSGKIAERTANWCQEDEQ